jgi:hypothetical protein
MVFVAERLGERSLEWQPERCRMRRSTQKGEVLSELPWMLFYFREVSMLRAEMFP